MRGQRTLWSRLVLAPPAPHRWRDRVRASHAWWIYLALAVVALAATAAAVRFPADGLVGRFAPNVATDALTALVTLAVVQRFLDRQERARRLRGSTGALRKASRALARMGAAWAALVRASLSRPPALVPSTLAELFADHLTEELMYCDPAAPRSAAAGDTWVRWAAAELAAGCGELREIVATRGQALDAEYTEAIDALVDDGFLQLVIDLSTAGEPDPRSWRRRVNAARGAREAHFARLLTALQRHNALAADAARLRGTVAAPRTTEFGITLAGDHDLRVATELDARWWAGEPPVGSACTREPAAPPLPPELQGGPG